MNPPMISSTQSLESSPHSLDTETRLRTTEPVQQDPATALVVRTDELSRSLSGFLAAHLFPQGGALGCYRVAPSAHKTLNLTCRLPSGCGPLRANPIFIIFIFVVD